MNKQILTFKKLREAKGYTQESLARAVGLSRLAIARYELKQVEPKLGNFLKIARLLKVSLAELALALGYEAEEEIVQVHNDNPVSTPAQNRTSEVAYLQVHNDNSGHAPAQKQSEGKSTGVELVETSLAESTLVPGCEAESESVQLCQGKSTSTPAQNSEVRSLQVHNDNLRCTPVKRRAKGKGTGFIEERVVKRGDKQYKQYWFHWQKTERGKGRVLARSKYIPKRLVARIIEKNHQKLPVREILRSLGVKKQF